MPDVFEVADLLVRRAVERHGDEVDVIGTYGSHAMGTARAGSDLDIFFVPAEGADPPIARTFLLDGVLFDFWAVPWETMEGFATGRLRGWSLAPAIVHHARLLHARSQEQAVRFAALKQKVRDLQAPEARPKMIRRALAEYARTALHLGNLRLAATSGDLADARHAGWKLVLSVWECLALANQVLLDRGWSDLLGEIPRLARRPEHLAERITAIATLSDPSGIAREAEQLALDTRRVLRSMQDSLPSTQTAGGVFDSAYPELRDMVGKVHAACSRRKEVTARVDAWFLQMTTSLLLDRLRSAGGDADFNLYHEFAGGYRDLGLSDLVSARPGELAALGAQATALDGRLREWLTQQNVDLCEYRTMAELDRAL